MPVTNLMDNPNLSSSFKDVERAVQFLENECLDIQQAETISIESWTRLLIRYENVLNSLRALSIPNLFESNGHTLLYIVLMRVKEVVGNSYIVSQFATREERVRITDKISDISQRLEYVFRYYEENCNGNRAGRFPEFPRIQITPLNVASHYYHAQSLTDRYQSRFVRDLREDFETIRSIEYQLNNMFSSTPSLSNVVFVNREISRTLSNIIALIRVFHYSPFDTVSPNNLEIQNVQESLNSIYRSPGLQVHDCPDLTFVRDKIDRARVSLRLFAELVYENSTVLDQLEEYVPEEAAPTDRTVTITGTGRTTITFPDGLRQILSGPPHMTDTGIRQVDEPVLPATDNTVRIVGAPSVTNNIRYASGNWTVMAEPSAQPGQPVTNSYRIDSVQPTPSETQISRNRGVEFSNANNSVVSDFERNQAIRSRVDSETYNVWRFQPTDFASIQNHEDLWNLYEDTLQEMNEDMGENARNYSFPTFTKKDVAKAYNLMVLYLRKVADVENNRVRQEFLLETSSEPNSYDFARFNHGRFLGFIQNNNRTRNRGPQHNQYVLEITDSEAARYFGVRIPGGRAQPRHLRNSIANAINFIQLFFPQNSQILNSTALRAQVIQFYQTNLEYNPARAGAHFGLNFVIPTVTIFDRTKKVSFPWMLMLDYKNWANAGVISPQPVILSDVRTNLIDEEYRRNLLRVMRSTGTHVPELADGRNFVQANNINNYIVNAIRTHDSYRTNSLVPLYDADTVLHNMMIKLISLSNRARDRHQVNGAFRNWNDGKFEIFDTGPVSEFRMSKQTVESILRIGSQGPRQRSSAYPGELVTALDKINALAATFGCRISSTTIRATDENRAHFPVDRGGNRLNEIRTFRVENFPIYNFSTYIQGQSPLIPRDPTTILEVPSFFRLNSIDNLIPSSMYQFLETIVTEEENRIVPPPATIQETGLYTQEFIQRFTVPAPEPVVDRGVTVTQVQVQDGIGCNCSVCRQQRERELQRSREVTQLNDTVRSLRYAVDSLEDQTRAIGHSSYPNSNNDVYSVSDVATEFLPSVYEAQLRDEFLVNDQQDSVEEEFMRRRYMETAQRELGRVARQRAYDDRNQHLHLRMMRNREPQPVVHQPTPVAPVAHTPAERAQRQTVQSQVANYLTSMFSSNRNQTSVQTEQSNNDVQASPLEE